MNSKNKWIEYANEDLEEAKEKLLKKKYRYACYFAQQAAEKFLKAFLIQNDKPFRKTHNILELIEMCKEIDGDFENLKKENVELLTSYAIVSRYPEFEIEISEEEAKEAIEIAEKVKEFVLKKLKEKLE
ncbi:MAG: HEPN domain-containing protein [Candidatus Aenigmatarchaeota archaeon]